MNRKVQNLIIISMLVSAALFLIGCPNDPYPVIEQVVDPVFSPAAGTYNGVQSVTISTTTESAVILYTTNGDDPAHDGAGAPSGSTAVYSSAIEVANSATLKAVGYKDGFTDSGIVSAAFVIPRRFVAVDDNGGIFYSENGGASWTAATESATVFLYSVEGDDNGNFVVTGDSGEVYYSTDSGESFTAGTSAATGWINDVAHNGAGTWMFIENAPPNNYGFLSTDNGETWSSLGGSLGFAGDIDSLTYGNGLWVNGDENGDIEYSSNNGTVWDNGTWAGTSRINDIVYDGNGNWVQVNFGSTDNIAYSTDGIDWTERATAPSTNTMYGVATDGYQFIAVGFGGVICYSTDGGVNWSARTSGVAVNLKDIATDGNGNWVAVGEGNPATVIFSTDGGETWEDGTFSSNDDLTSVAAGY